MAPLKTMSQAASLAITSARVLSAAAWNRADFFREATKYLEGVPRKSENYGQGAPFRVLTAALTPGLNLFSFNQALELPVLANQPNGIPQGLFVGQQSGSH